MPRIKGSGLAGPVRALRLPLAIDAWFQQLLLDEPQRSSTELLLRVIHAGLPLRSGHFERHVAALSALYVHGQESDRAAYMRALADSFDEHYIEHVRTCAREAIFCKQ